MTINTPHVGPLIRETLYKKIEFAMSVLRVSAEQRGEAGLTDLNVVAESFFCKFLNELDKINLQNLNDGLYNHPALDLGDVASGVCWQVTATRTLGKIKHTLKKFGEYNYVKTYHELNILVIGKRRPVDSLKITVPTGLSFDPSKNIFDIPTILKKVKKADPARLNALSALVDAEMPFFASMNSLASMSDNDAMEIYRSFFLRGAFWDDWSVEGSVQDLKDALNQIKNLLTTGVCDGKAVVKPIRQLTSGLLRSEMELVKERLNAVSQLVLHHERVGHFDLAANIGNFDDPSTQVAFNTYRQAVIDQLNTALKHALLPPVKGVQPPPP